jgi:hypothetical protein
MADLKIHEADVLEPPAITLSDDEERVEVAIPVAGRTYTVQFPVSRKDDISYGLRRVADGLDEIGS